VSRFARAVVIVAVLLAASAVLAQPATRRLTTIDALRQFPGYFHLQPVVVRGEFSGEGTRVLVRADEHEIRVLMNDARPITGPAEVRGQMIDVGRLEPGDPRLSGYAGTRDEERWPRPGEELILNVTGVAAAQPASSPSVRALALEPWRFVDQKVTLVGQFRGRNLFGDLPAAPSKTRYDFVLRAADAAVWVTGLRPRGKGFDLNVDARVDTGRWLEVAGTVKHDNGLVSVEAASIVAAVEPKLTTEPEVAVPLLPLPPVEVVFSSPTEGETDVSANSSVRIQFSRSIDPKTLKGLIRIAYLGAESVERGEPQPPSIEVQTAYDPASRALELKFAKPLERFRTVKVQLLEGIKAFDGAPVTPWSLTFSVGG
jgi:hypothetical protein